MSKPLTLPLIAQKAKTDALYSIKSLNLWGNDLDDISMIERLPNLEVLSLSVNRISTLSDIAKCKNIRELYLRKNSIASMEELLYLQALPNLKVLWLQENPIADHPNYKECVIMNSPNLEKLDDVPITIQDRQNLQNPPMKQQYSPQPPVRYTQPRVDEEQYVDVQRSIVNQTPQRASQLYQPEQQRASQVYQPEPQRVSQVYQPEPRQLSYRQSQEQQPAPQYSQQQSYIPPNQQQYSMVAPPEYYKQQETYDSQTYDRNENILCAILSLLKELDMNSLMVVQREVDKSMKQFD